MTPQAFYFPGPVREPEIIVIALNECAAKVEFEKISGKIVTPKKRHAVILACASAEEILRVMEKGDTPKRKYESVDPDEFPLLSYFGGNPPDIDDHCCNWDTEACFINDALSWLHLEDGEDLRQRIDAEMRRWERKYEQ